MGEADGGRAFRAALCEAHVARPDVTGWAYTHAGTEPEVIEWRDTLPANLTIVASADTVAQARRLLRLGWQHVSLVVATQADSGHFSTREVREVRALRTAAHPLPCPAQTTKMGCADCGACFLPRKPGRKPLLIAFGTHSRLVSKARVLAVAGGCYAQAGWILIDLDRRAAANRGDPVAWVRSLPRSTPGRPTLIRWLVGGDLWSDWRAARAKRPVPR